MVSRRVGGVILLVCGSFFPVGLGAQASQPVAAAPGAPQTDQQHRGEALFLKNCALCHIHTAQKARLKIQAATELVGLFKRPAITDDRVRQVLHGGVPGLMPAFQYALSPGELEDLLAYLKIR